MKLIKISLTLLAVVMFMGVAKPNTDILSGCATTKSTVKFQDPTMVEEKSYFDGSAQNAERK